MKLAVVGLGHMGRIHLSKLVSFRDISIEAVSDISHVLLIEQSTKNGIRGFDDFRKVVNLCDCVIIATPTETHFNIAKTFLDARKHVFMEKPITIHPFEAEELIKIAHKNNVVFQIGHLERLNPAFIKARSLIKKPILIEARRISPFTGRSTDVDVVLDLMIHDLDLILSVSDSEVCGVSAQGICFVTNKPDAANARIEFTNGCVATVTASRMSTEKNRSMSVYEENQYIHADLLQGKLASIFKTSEGSIETIDYTANHMDPVHDELRHFIDSVEGGMASAASGIDGLKALLLAQRIRECIAGNKRATDQQS